MIRSEVVAGLKRAAGYEDAEWITKRQIGNYLGYKDTHDISAMIYGVSRIKTHYCITEVADRIMGSIERDQEA